MQKYKMNKEKNVTIPFLKPNEKYFQGLVGWDNLSL